MNILPKKRWHVRTKENIARVRRDEAKAAEEEKARIQRAKLAEQEARTDVLRHQARAVYDGRDTSGVNNNEKPEHINFFKELEEGLVAFTGTNKEYEKEKKEEKEKYEKQIGYLTYLGQDTVEATGNISWYNKVPDRLISEESKNKNDEKETHVKSKTLIDPLNCIRRYLGMTGGATSKERPKQNNDVRQKTGKIDIGVKRKREEDSSEEEKHKKHKHKKSKKKRSRSKEKHSKKKRKRDSSESSDDNEPVSNSRVNLSELRAKRIQREKEEKVRAERALAKLRGETLPEDKPLVSEITQKYSSQFNPHIAKQNFSSDRRSRN